MKTELVAGGAHIWRVRLDQPAARVRALFHVLDETERARAGAFLRDRDRSGFVVAHASLRQILSGYVAAAPTSLRFVGGSHGKPALATPGPHFNLSHSDGLALVAVAPDRPIGVDVERVRRDCEVDAIAQRFFGAAEVELLLQSRDDVRLARFFRLWTCKESCLKADGRGIGALERIGIWFDGAGKARTSPWAITELKPAHGYVAAVATRGRAPSLDHMTWMAGPVNQIRYHHNNACMEPALL